MALNIISSQPLSPKLWHLKLASILAADERSSPTHLSFLTSFWHFPWATIRDRSWAQGFATVHL